MTKWILVFMAFASLAIAETPLETAYALYHQGEQATEVGQQEQAYNAALKILLEQAKTQPSSQLYTLTGDTYFQLGKYGWAILYYERALRISARDAITLKHLHQAQAKLNIPSSTTAPFASQTEQLLLAFGALVILFIVCSLWVWQPHQRVWRHATTFVGIFLFLAIGSLAYSHYGAPTYAIVIHSTQLFSKPDQNASSQEALIEGHAVQLLDAPENGQWLHVQTSDGKIGFAPYQALRVI